MTEPCCMAAAHGQACTCRRADFWPVNMPQPACDWRELHQHEQPRLSDGYTAVMFIRPGVYLVKGPGPSKHPVPSGDYHEGIEEGWKAGDALQNRIAGLEAENKRLRDAAIRSGAALAATISLLERGGKRAAPSDKMFKQMLEDYRGALRNLRDALRGEGEERE